MSQRPLVSIVILCHNDARFLRGCAASVRRWTRLPYELVFVDNGSKDGALEELRRIRRDSPRPVRILRNRENRYFAGGNNQGIRASRGRHVVLLNADTLVTPRWLEPLVDCVERRPEVGLAAPRTNHASGLQVVWPPAYSDRAGLDAWARRRSAELRGRIRLVPMLIGFCLLVPRGALDRIGLLDERFGPGGFEDYDLCLRARLAGRELALCEDSYVHHFGGRGYVAMPYDELRERNRRLFWELWTDKVRRRFEPLEASHGA